ncbi:hypothetical protein N0V90_008404 [Kalmusia sp. IMI 367209]|nr:hypothetical protein N0V90_008404 [Kalmusia sp. IMI 367209]
MDDPGRAPFRLARDDFHMDPMEMSCFDVRSHIPAPRRSQDSKAFKRKGTSSPPHISLTSYNANGYWITTSSHKRGRIHNMQTLQNLQGLQPQKESQLDLQMHQSTCLNLNADANSTEADLWILPDFDDWEADGEAQQQDYQTAKKGSDWAPLVKRAVNSNRERLRRRLEGDGWDFVGGKYGEDGVALKEVVDANEEKVDEEFDVVVLPVVHVSC